MNNLYLILFIGSIFLASYSQILLKKGTREQNIYINKYTIMGYGIMFLSTILTLVGYRYIDLSLGQILQSLSFIFVILFSYIFLKEKITKQEIIGFMIIVIGLIIFNI